MFITVENLVFLGASVCLSVCPSAWSNLTLTGRILMKFGICVHVKNMSKIPNFINI